MATAIAVSANAAPGTKISHRVSQSASTVREVASSAPHSGVSGISAATGGPVRTTVSDSSMLMDRTVPTSTPSTPSSATSTSEATTC